MAIISDYVQKDKITSMTFDFVSYTSIAHEVMRVTNDFQGTAVSMPVATKGTIKTYTKDTDLTKDDIGDSEVNIPIDDDKYMLDGVDGYVDKKSAQKVSVQVGRNQGETMAEYIDTACFQKVFDQAGITGADFGITTAPSSITTKEQAEAYVATVKTALKTAKIAPSKWYMVVPVWLETLIMKSLAFSPSGGAQNDAIVNGNVGRMYGIPIYSTTTLPTGVAGGIVAGEEAVIAGSKDASDILYSIKDAENGSMMPTRKGEYFAQFLSMGCGAN
jgi:hypothetical protein